MAVWGIANRAVRQDILQCGDTVKLAPTFDAKYKLNAPY